MAEPTLAHVELVAALLSAAPDPDAAMNLAQLIAEPVLRVPDRVALILGDEETTYAALGVAIANCADQLERRGVGPGDSVPVLDDCSPLLIAALYGAAHLGAAIVPMHVELQTAELCKVMELSGCGSVGIAGAAFTAKLSEALGRAPLGSDEILGGGAAPSSKEPCADLELPCVKILTSGTTGLPKPIAISHRTFVPRMASFSNAFDPEGPFGRSLLCVPGVHIGGLGGLVVGLAGGNTLVILQRFRAGDWLRIVERHRINNAFLVPTMLRRILDHPDFDKADLASLRHVSYGAAAAPVSMVEEMIRRFPQRVAFTNVYGQTETTGAITSFGPKDHVLDENGRLLRGGSVGRLIPGVEHRLVSPETGDDVGEGEAGELWVRSAFNAAEGWNATGDLIRIDEEGYLYPVGRLADTINRGGEKFGPVEIENALRMHPAVGDVAAAGIADPELGERVGVAIVRVGALTVDDVLAHCAEHLARFKVPERIAFVDEIPHTNLWKVSRRQVAELITRELERDA